MSAAAPSFLPRPLPTAPFPLRAGEILLAYCVVELSSGPPPLMKTSGVHLMLTNQRLSLHSSMNSSVAPLASLPLLAVDKTAASTDKSPLAHLRVLYFLSGNALIRVDTTEIPQALVLLFPTKEERAFLRGKLDENVEIQKKKQTNTEEKKIENEKESTKAPAAPAIPRVVLPPIALSAETRAALLARNPSLKALHSDLVDKSKALTEAEFWDQHKDLHHADEEIARRQILGVSSTIPRDAQRLQGTSVTLTAADIHQIFLDYPAVHDAYIRLVPDQLSEKDFFTKFFESRQIHESRASSALKQGGDIFTAALDEAEKKLRPEEIRKRRDEQTKRIIAQKAVDPSVDLTQADADDSIVFGMAKVMADRERGGRGAVVPGIASKKAKENRELVERYNRHSRLIVKERMGRPSSEEAENSIGASGDKRRLEYEKKLSESLRMEELEKSAGPTLNKLTINEVNMENAPSPPAGAPAAATSNATTPTPATSSTPNSVDRKPATRPSTTPADVLSFLDSLISSAPATKSSSPFDLLQYYPSSYQSYRALTSISSFSSAQNRAQQLIAEKNQEFSLGDSSEEPKIFQYKIFKSSTEAGNSSSSSGQSSSSDILIPPAMEKSLKDRFSTLSELSRHFWSCFPYRPEWENKIIRIKTALDLQYGEILQWRERLYQEGNSSFVGLLESFMRRLERIHEFYQKWEKEKKRKMQGKFPTPTAGNLQGGIVKMEPGLTNNIVSTPSVVDSSATAAAVEGENPMKKMKI